MSDRPSWGEALYGEATARIKRFERELHILGMILVIGAVLGVGGWLAGSGEAGAPVPAPTVTAVQSAAVGTPSAEGLCPARPRRASERAW